jgi:hypothetical protein
LNGKDNGILFNAGFRHAGGTITETGGGKRIMRHKQILATLAIMGALLSACGGSGSGSGGSSSPPPAAKTVGWAPPQYFTDNTLVIPASDLKHFEIYVKQDSSFGPDDNAIATAPPVDTTFNLATLFPPLSRGVTYYVSVRAVPVDGEKSDFSSPAAPFSIPK